jgi:hypothetical protein
LIEHMRITGTNRITHESVRTTKPARAMVAALTVAVLALTLVALLSGGSALARGGKHVKRYWLYDPGSLSRTWKSEAKLRHQYNRWHRNRLDELRAEAAEETTDHAETLVERATDRAEQRGDELTNAEVREIEKDAADDGHDKIEVPNKEIKAFQAKLQKRYLEMHFNKPAGTFSGKATWFGGQRGACGKPLVGMYAAHRNLPCGTRLSVRSGGKYVHVTVLDRGPYTGAVLDLSKQAFSELSPLGAGVINVHVTKLKGK